MTDVLVGAGILACALLAALALDFAILRIYN